MLFKKCFLYPLVSKKLIHIIAHHFFEKKKKYIKMIHLNIFNHLELEIKSFPSPDPLT